MADLAGTAASPDPAAPFGNLGETAASPRSPAIRSTALAPAADLLACSR